LRNETCSPRQRRKNQNDLARLTIRFCLFGTESGEPMVALCAARCCMRAASSMVAAARATGAFDLYLFRIKFDLRSVARAIRLEVATFAPLSIHRLTARHASRVRASLPCRLSGGVSTT
jgi:hypothetical protein